MSGGSGRSTSDVVGGLCLHCPRGRSGMVGVSQEVEDEDLVGRHIIITVRPGRPLKVNIESFNKYEAAEVLYRAQMAVADSIEDAVVIGQRD